MKKLIFGLIATVLISFMSNAEEKTTFIRDGLCLDVVHEKQFLEKDNLAFELNKKNNVRFCFNVGISISLTKNPIIDFSINATVEVCCWRRTSRSPKYDCSVGENRAANSEEIGYIDLEKLDKNFLQKIDSENETFLKIEKSEIINFDDYKLTIKSGEYEIFKDDEGRYLQVIMIKTMNSTSR